jgi:transposase
MVAAIGTGGAFSKGRDFAAWLGLVPKQISRFIDRRKAAPSREVYNQFSVLACKRSHEGEQRIAASPLDRRKDGRKIN